MPHLFLNDNGRATCLTHAGAYLQASFDKQPNAQFHDTPLGTWERFTVADIRLFGDEIECDRCSKSH